MRATINSEKHYRAISLNTVEFNTAESFELVVAVDVPGVAPAEVRVGATVKAVWLELWYLMSGSQPGFQVSTFEKIVAGQDSPTSAQMSDLQGYPNKKNILQTYQGLVGDANSNPIPVFRGWIKIPKGKQRMGLGDSISVNVAARGEAGNDLEICGMAIFKEYY